MLKRVLMVLAVLVLLSGAAFGALIYWKSKHPDRRVALGPPVDNVTADLLVYSYADNEVAADAQYRDKVIAVYGVARMIKRTTSDEPYVFLSTRDPIHDVHAYFQSESGLDTIHPGDEISIECIGNSVASGCPQLKSCAFIEHVRHTK